MAEFKIHSDYQPTGDQPQAIAALTEGVQKGFKHQVLLGVTGSGKTFTMANIIKNLGRPALVIAHNKTLAAQLAGEFREFFPENAVGYFVSYYDYYQPEALSLIHISTACSAPSTSKRRAIPAIRRIFSSRFRRCSRWRGAPASSRRRSLKTAFAFSTNCARWARTCA